MSWFVKQGAGLYSGVERQGSCTGIKQHAAAEQQTMQQRKQINRVAVWWPQDSLGLVRGAWWVSKVSRCPNQIMPRSFPGWRPP